MRYIARTVAVISIALAAGVSCNPGGLRSFSINPFTDLQPLAFDGTRQTITSAISPLGMRRAGEVLKITVMSDSATAAYILRRDDERTNAGVILDGGPINEAFFHRVATDAELFLYVDAPNQARATVVLEFGPADFRKPAGQAIAIEFEEDFLVEGLFDPATNNEADRQFLVAIEPNVRREIVERLREIFSGTGVAILGPDDDRPADHSLITYSGRRELARGNELDGLPVLGCSEIVIFGEVLPKGQNLDAGNQDQNDVAVVYTGSFRGTGDCDPGLVVNSTNNIINTLALSGAHEAGHLLGLNHTALDGLMSAEPSFAIQRQLGFQRSQIVLDQGGDLFVVTSVIQDPQVYFDTIFSP